MLALLDCNNFFVSCERLYRPSLKNKPVVVLSSNDGCIISRSNEVKAMGVPMGEPYFRVEKFLKSRGVAVCSGNIAAYKEISNKVMSVLSRYTDGLEEYSIDEAFFNFPEYAVPDPVSYSAGVRGEIDRQVGIPASIGIAMTKTLSKLASQKAKKTESGVAAITKNNSDSILQTTPVGDVWGIGRKNAEKLNRFGIITAFDFVRKDPVWIKKIMSIRGVMTQYELRSQPCYHLVTERAKPKSIQVSRTWGRKITSVDDIERAIIDNILKAGTLLRRDCLAAKSMCVYIRRGYRHHGECAYLKEDFYFNEPVMSDIELINTARDLIRKIFIPGYQYTQGGITLCNFTDANYRQRALFDDGDEQKTKYERISHVTDEINYRLGRRAIYPAALAVKDKPWKPHREHLGR